MGITTELHVVPSSSLANLNVIVAQNEALIGPLVKIGNDGTQTQLFFDNQPNSPAVSAVIAPQAGGRPVIPTGSTLVCTGTIFVVGQPVLSAATRA